LGKNDFGDIGKREKGGTKVGENFFSKCRSIKKYYWYLGGYQVSCVLLDKNGAGRKRERQGTKGVEKSNNALKNWV